MLILELAVGGVLRERLRHHPELPMQKLLHYSTDAARGMRYLAQMKVWWKRREGEEADHPPRHCRSQLPPGRARRGEDLGLRLVRGEQGLHDGGPSQENARSMARSRNSPEGQSALFLSPLLTSSHS